MLLALIVNYHMYVKQYSKPLFFKLKQNSFTFKQDQGSNISSHGTGRAIFGITVALV